MPKLLLINICICIINSFIYHESDCANNYPAGKSQNKIFLQSQPTVITEEREFALFYVIYVSTTAKHNEIKEGVKVLARLQEHVAAVAPFGDPVTEIIAGVGFGEQFYAKIRPDDKKRFTYVKRNGKLGAMPATGGDIFIHAKSNSTSKLFELVEKLSVLLKEITCTATDLYTFQYRINRDITGFIDGTHNPKGDEARREVAVIPQTGGSFSLTQRWVHDLHKINSLKPSVIESFIGRTLPDSTEIENKLQSAHIARVEGGTNLPNPVFEIVRQSMPYGTVHGEAGLFFVAYAVSVANFDFMLDRMVGAKDNIPDDLMRLTRCVSGNYWYFPGVEELKYFYN